jgi:lipopolysaccharide transport protein LptA
MLKAPLFQNTNRKVENKIMFILFILSLFFSSSAFADFQDNLPTDFPSEKRINHNNLQNDIQKNTTPQPKKEIKKPKEEEKNTVNSSNKTGGAFSTELGNHDSSAPVLFSGQHGDGSRTTGILNLVGDVVITQDDTTLKSNKAKIFSTPGNIPTPGGSRIQKAIATGNVNIFKKATASAPEIRATGDETELIVPSRILILRGKAKVWRTKEYLNGDTIKINLQTGDIDILRPEGTIDPKAMNHPKPTSMNESGK